MEPARDPPLACGIALNLFADGVSHQAETTVKPFETPGVLVTTGVFRISRNPMYLGYVLILIGVGLLLRSLTPFVVIPVFGLLMARVFIREEEQMLQETFGAAWQSYAGQARRWIWWPVLARASPLATGLVWPGRDALGRCREQGNVVSLDGRTTEGC